MLEMQHDSMSAVYLEQQKVFGDVFVLMNGVAENLSFISGKQDSLINTINSLGITSESDLRSVAREVADLEARLFRSKMSLHRLERNSSDLGSSSFSTEAMNDLIASTSEKLATAEQDLRSLNKAVSATTLAANLVPDSVYNFPAAGQEEAYRASFIKAYYIVGSRKDLIDTKIIVTPGIQWSRMEVNQSAPLTDFNEIEIDKFFKLEINHAGVELISDHPGESYRWIKDRRAVTKRLEIIDPGKFWQNTKVMVISYRK